MADFNEAFAATGKNEGGYANHPNDKGGETYTGISRKFWPGWNGWEIVDSYKTKTGFPKNLSGDSELQNRVKDFYRRNFWSHLFDDIKSQIIANWLYDKRVNCGQEMGVKLLQRAVGVTDDGKFGYVTLNAVNTTDPKTLREKLREVATTYYLNIVKHDSAQSVFLDGWLKRV